MASDPIAGVSGASGIVKPLFCARAMRVKGAKEDRAHGAYLRGARTASGESRSRADLHIPKVEMCRGQFFYAPRGPRYVRVNVARTYACGRCSLFSSKPFHSPSSSSNDPQYFAPRRRMDRPVRETCARLGPRASSEAHVMSACDRPSVQEKKVVVESSSSSLLPSLPLPTCFLPSSLPLV